MDTFKSDRDSQPIARKIETKTPPSRIEDYLASIFKGCNSQLGMIMHHLLFLEQLPETIVVKLLISNSEQHLQKIIVNTLLMHNSHTILMERLQEEIEMEHDTSIRKAQSESIDYHSVYEPKYSILFMVTAHTFVQILVGVCKH